jgi:hypothetical protein
MIHLRYFYLFHFRFRDFRIFGIFEDFSGISGCQTFFVFLGGLLNKAHQPIHPEALKVYIF